MLALLAVTAVWGSTFILLKDVLDRIPASDYLAVRFGLAAVVLAAVSGPLLRKLSRVDWWHGAIMGSVYGAAQLLQAVGLHTTEASVSGFVTGMYVVFTPLLAMVLFGVRLGWNVWTSVAVAIVGFAALTLPS